MHFKDVVLSVACSIKHTYLENRILKICDKFFFEKYQRHPRRIERCETKETSSKSKM